MDILKLLSRGTKKTSNQNQQSDLKPASKTVNPQLFNDPTRGLKRKRNEEQPQLSQEDDDGLEIDFFAPQDTKKPVKQAPVPNELPETKLESPLLDEETVRQVLRSHRLKVTLLSSHDKKTAKVKKAKKKESVKPKAKDTKKQLFPQPLTSFAELRATYNISPRLESNLITQGFRIPTEIQLGSLPMLMDPNRAIPALAAEEFNFSTSNGIDFLGVAPTGSGKTLSFLIPTINNIMRWRAEDENQKEHVLEAIIVAPTKELCHQIGNEGRKIAQGTGVKIVEMKKNITLPTESLGADDLTLENESDGDNESVSSDDESDDHEVQRKTATKTNILVTTPLVLQNLLKSKTLPTVKSLILDEVDVLLDDAFRSQTVGIWSACTNPDLRLTCWSATMGSHIEGFILDQLKSRASPERPVPLIRLVVGLKDTAVPLVKHKLVYTATEQGKLFALRQLLHPKSSSNTLPFMQLPFLVFTQTIERATALHAELKFDFPIEAGGSSRIAVLHSALPDAARSKVMARFRAGEIFVLITTDLLMRGIDLVGVNGVVNYDLPATAAAYVHRVGRTGRAGHDGGVAVTFYTTEDVAHLKTIANVIALSEKQAGKQEGEGMPKWLIDSLPKVSKEEKKKLKERGVESRRGNKAKITSKSAWERRKENNRRGAIAGSKKRKVEGSEANVSRGGESEWGGIAD
ncbi:P-loop containing nucleoside triphosphate hydrolase protein [Camillea tinctor]|nr:P-loop containing nucleoside triphosphate hydrolase protein [Camillea tinctor]